MLTQRRSHVRAPAPHAQQGPGLLVVEPDVHSAALGRLGQQAGDTMGHPVTVSEGEPMDA
ncbi:hypothetical protein OG426_44340 [Streptomyces canus]|uniref:hypothetical protein n=1 Tax=Streptomyces canus TaxID=58343 RepID=UPI00386D7DD9|nr:hypothetical protein OG426_44340 [Streptomyces canus]